MRGERWMGYVEEAAVAHRRWNRPGLEENIPWNYIGIILRPKNSNNNKGHKDCRLHCERE